MRGQTRKRGPMDTIYHAIKLSTTLALLVFRHRSVVREFHVALFDSPDCQWPLYCRHARVDCKSGPFSSRGLLRNRNLRDRFAHGDVAKGN